jgi:D-sedoheptulose 7-phosphate isomerase
MNDPATFAREYADRVSSLMARLPFDELGRAIDLLEATRRSGRTVFLIGNGGSAATSSHMANDLMLTVAKRGAQGFRVVSLADNAAILTAIANDEDYMEIFASQLERLGEPGDLLIAISGSGRSPNIVRALGVAQVMGLRTIGILGMDGGPARELVDVPVVVPSDDYGTIEDAHVVIDHLITEWFQRSLPEA